MRRLLRMNLLPLAMLAASSTVSVCLALPTTAPVLAVETFSSYQHQIQFTYPMDWVKRNVQAPQIAFQMRPPGKEEALIGVQVILQVVPAPKDVRAGQFFDSVLNNEAQTTPQFQMGNEADIEWGGVPARKGQFDWKLMAPMKSMRVVAIRDDKAFVLSYDADAASFDQYLPQVEQMIGSTKWQVDAPAKTEPKTPPAPRPAKSAARPAIQSVTPLPPVVAATPPRVTKINSKDAAAKISFELPSNWTEVKVAPQEGAFSARQFGLMSPKGGTVANILVMAHKAGPDNTKSIAAVKQAYLGDQGQVGTALKVSRVEPSQVDKSYLEIVRATFNSQDRPMKRVFVFTAKADVGYMFSMQAVETRFDEVEPAFMEFIQSVRWAK